MDIYFIANNKTLDNGIFTKYRSDIWNGDVLHFNQCIYFEYFENHPRNIVFHNLYGKKLITWFGINREPYYSCFCIKDKYLCFDSNDKNIPEWVIQIEQWKMRGGKLIPFVKGRSAGFMAYEYFRPFYKHIFLVGFTFQGWGGHNWEYEKSTMLNDPTVTLILK